MNPLPPGHWTTYDIYIDVTKLPPWDLKDFVVDDLRQQVWRSGDLVFGHVVPTEIIGNHG